MKIELTADEIKNIRWAVRCFIVDAEYRKKLNRPIITEKDLADSKNLKHRFDKIEVNIIYKNDIDLSEDELGVIYSAVWFVIDGIEKYPFDYPDVTDEDINDLDELEDKFYKLLDEVYEKNED